MFETVAYEMQNGVAEIRLNRPHRLNAVVQKLYDDVLAALDEAEGDKTVRVIVLTGEGRAFCVGADLKEHKAGRTAFDRRQYLMSEQRVCKRLVSHPKPIIAGVNGFALGAGAEIALACDFMIMAASARIGFPEIGLGAYLGGGVTNILPRLVGLAKARDLIFFGRQIDGAEAVRIGLASRCIPDKEFAEGIRALASELAKKAPFSMQLAKEQLASAAHGTFDSALTAELEGMTFCSTTRDWQEGVDAFAEKRSPIFRGE
ncbi:enoyl-CoA hydratase/isomerase family protein [Mesorhizobium sp. VK25A]|uniref:Enoyl-CoA hydratase/isomerase family protein n=1 Tax=Mesorhizobium vachelliae TaxID=3072309 RepID=A0ABU5AF04_9HYPH|nr:MULTISPECIES: enoyl-CoA hydratase/isomerase family protein [unclassified Mesorhizobium]MDX8535869.1 enoyl-CoA hydratase/isomerase family protein [Mesorhizobium sp. VK25D]MDX8548623.1 enoyl-CoA hydratase/isomerase family protein [Mesorhizobium sp. VK25A]